MKKGFFAVLLLAAVLYCMPLQIKAYTANVSLPYSTYGELDSSSGTTNEGTYKDTYKFYGYSGDTIYVDLSSDDFDTVIYLLDSNAKRIATDDDGGSGTDSYMEYTLDRTGYYSVVASQYSRRSGEYYISIDSDGSSSYYDDYGNDIYDAESIGLNAGASSSVYGDIEEGGDVDVFRFTAPATGDYSIYTVDGDTDIDSYGTLYNSNGSVIAEDDDSDVGSNFCIDIKLYKGEVYYIEVRAYSSRSTGSYKVKVIAPDEPVFTTVVNDCRIDLNDPLLDRGFRADENGFRAANMYFNYDEKDSSQNPHQYASCFGLSSVAALEYSGDFSTRRTKADCSGTTEASKKLSFGYDVSGVGLFSGSRYDFYDRSSQSSYNIANLTTTLISGNPASSFNPVTSAASSDVQKIAKCIGWYQYYQNIVKYACEDQGMSLMMGVGSNRKTIDQLQDFIDNEAPIVACLDYYTYTYNSSEADYDEDNIEHAVVPERLFETVNKNSYVLEVYDCNHPGVSQYIELETDSNGTITAFNPFGDERNTSKGFIQFINLRALDSDSRFN